MISKKYTVGQINTYVKNLFLRDGLLSSVAVEGEVSNCKYHSSGHIYFSLKDESGTLQCVMFSSSRRGLSFDMKDGDKVVVGGSVSVYERDGRYQLYARTIARTGGGELYERFIALRDELKDMGYFDPMYKKPIPAYCMRVGVVTASTGAAIRDIQNITTRRNPFVQLILCPALVQGEGAKESIARGIARLDRMGLDVIIVGRGGGSIEDLWAFNERVVAEAIFNCRTPVISAVGHETDTTISDFVADMRAPTPSAAAELAVFSFGDLMRLCGDKKSALGKGLDARINSIKSRTDILRAHLKAASPAARAREMRLKCDQIMIALPEAFAARCEKASLEADRIRRELTLAAEARTRAYVRRAELTGERLKGLDPSDRLRQGYAFVEGGDGRPLKGVRDTGSGDTVRAYLRDGVITAEVISAAEKEY